MENLETIVNAVVQDNDCTLWGTERLGVQPVRLAVYIERVGGVTVELCETVTDALSIVLPVECPDLDVQLEVSSPGLNRQFFNADQAKNYIDSNVAIHLVQPIDDQRKFEGTLLSVQDDIWTLQVGKNTLEVPFSSIKVARLVPVFNFGSGKKS